MKIQSINSYQVAKSSFQRRTIENSSSKIITKCDPVKDMNKKFKIAAIALLLIESIGDTAIYLNSKTRDAEKQNKEITKPDANNSLQMSLWNQ